MQIRHKINLWITSLGLLVNLVLASIILFEAVELPYEALDEELEIQIREDLKTLDRIKGQALNYETLDELLDFDDLYWIKVLDQNKNIIFTSEFAKHISIPFKESKEGYNYKVIIPENSGFYTNDPGTREDLLKDKTAGRNEIKKTTLLFRLNQFKIDMGEDIFDIRIARSVEDIEKEIDELIHIVATGFFVAAVILLVFSYFLTAKILQPIIEINDLAKEISASNMAKRIPLTKNKDELYILSQSLNNMFDRLQQAFKNQKQLVADAAHELKSPITMLLLFMEGSMERRDLPLEYSRQLISQANILRRMSRLVKNLLEISILEQKESLNFEVFDLGLMMGKIVNDFEAVFEAAGIQVENMVPPKYQIMGDWEKLQRLFINLLDNAVKYNIEDGKIKIGFTEKDGYIHISIWNTGIGIPKEDLKNVLKKFYRVEKSRSQKHGGSGLGLTIVHQIARLHRGDVVMESEHTKWCRANIILPDEVCRHPHSGIYF